MPCSVGSRVEPQLEASLPCGSRFHLGHVIPPPTRPAYCHSYPLRGGMVLVKVSIGVSPRRIATVAHSRVKRLGGDDSNNQFITSVSNGTVEGQRPKQVTDHVIRQNRHALLLNDSVWHLKPGKLHRNRALSHTSASRYLLSPKFPILRVPLHNL